MMAGVPTTTEVIQRAGRQGSRILKVFPARQRRRTRTLKVKASLPQSRWWPTAASPSIDGAHSWAAARVGVGPRRGTDLEAALKQGGPRSITRRASIC